MAMFPITGYCAGDHIPHLVAVDTEDTMDQVAAKVAHHTVGKKVPTPAGGSVYDVFIGETKIDAGVTLGSLGIEPMEWVDVRPREVG